MSVMPVQRVRPVVAVFLAAWVLGSVQARQPTFVAVIDGDGRLTPMAVFDGLDWWNRWPWQAESDPILLPTPTSLATIPANWFPPGLKLPLEWHALERSGQLVPFRAAGVERSPQTSLMRTFLISTTYRPGAAGYDEGVAISGPGVPGRFIVPARHEQSAILGQLAARLAVLEDQAVEHWKKTGSVDAGDSALTRTFRITGSFGARYVSRPPRDSQDFGLVKAESTIDGRSYYYLGGEKLFKLRPAEECMMNLSSEGLVVVNTDGRVVSERLSSTAFAEYCGDRAESLNLLATIALGDRTWWIVRMGLEDGYDYGLLDPLSGELVNLKGSGEGTAK